ncbi:MAG: mandelate racemase/muconate lactonizing enzyme family protein [Candidatus Bathyarchaeia archaeon]
MKITKVESLVLRLPNVRDIVDGTQDDIVIRIETDEGIVGIGEVDAPPTVVKAMMEAPLSHSWAKGLEQLLLGENPLNIGYLWEKLYQGSILYGRRGLTLNTLSGIDIALWDIAGKHYKTPTYRLLGGRPNNHVTPYSSIHPFAQTANEVIEKCRKLVKDQHFKATKFQCEPIGVDDRKALEFIKLARDELGEKIDIMLDACMCYDTKGAIKFARQLEQYNIYFLEAALHPDNLDGYAKLSASTTVRIAAGEEQTSRFMFIDLMDRGKVDIVQPDVTRAGGLTECKRIADLAADRGILCIPHCYKTNIGLAATLHLSAAASNSPYTEFPQSNSPLKKELTHEDFKVLPDGTIELPETPGLGVTLNEDAVTKYLYEKK